MSQVGGKDVQSGTDRGDRRLKDKLMRQFVNTDSHSRPCTPEYAENYDRIFGKRPASDSVDTVTEPWCADCEADHEQCPPTKYEVIEGHPLSRRIK